jgi:hypothetical protein
VTGASRFLIDLATCFATLAARWQGFEGAPVIEGLPVRCGQVTNQVARGCVVPPWREGGQAQYIERPVPAPSAAGTAHTRAWALERLHAAIGVSPMAYRRTFHTHGSPPAHAEA